MTFTRRLYKSLILSAHFAVNRWAWLRLALGRVDSRNGSSHRKLSLAESVAYIDRIFQHYVKRSGLDPSTLPGKKVLEIGPGDNLGVALRFLAAGAESVVAIDRFFSHRDRAKERQIYLALRETLPPREQALFDDAIDLRQGIRLNEEKLR